MHKLNDKYSKIVYETHKQLRKNNLLNKKGVEHLLASATSAMPENVRLNRTANKEKPPT